jgi:hypothetical protein
VALVEPPDQLTVTEAAPVSSLTVPEREKFAVFTSAFCPGEVNAISGGFISTLFPRPTLNMSQVVKTRLAARQTPMKAIPWKRLFTERVLAVFIYLYPLLAYGEDMST